MDEIPELLIGKHEKFFNRCLQGLPSKLQSEDCNKLAFIYFCLHGLGVTKKLAFSAQEQSYHVNQIHRNFLVEKEDTIAFRSTSSFKHAGDYDLPSLSATFFALASLLALNSDYSQTLNNHKIMKFVKSCQVTSGTNKGSFVPTLTPENNHFGDTDLRLCYVAACIRKLVKYDELKASERLHDIDTEALSEYILARVGYNGGFSSQILDEPHLGFTFCGLAALKLIGYDVSNTTFAPTLAWLSHRQVAYPENLYASETYQYYDAENDTGGFNGRENKFSDTCYSWWCTASLCILDRQNLALIDKSLATRYLVANTQNQLLGGFGKDPQAFPDPFHTFLALASLALWNPDSPTLDSIDPELVITQTSKTFLDSHIHY